jgi:hypothetical protein
MVLIPRYDLAASTKKLVGRSAIVPSSAIDATSLLYYTSVFVGAGGTMTAEAALLGVPTFSCYPGEPYIIEKYLIKKRLVARETDPEKIRKIDPENLDNCDHVKQRKSAIAQELVKTYEDPIEPITREIEKSNQYGGEYRIPLAGEPISLDPAFGPNAEHIFAEIGYIRKSEPSSGVWICSSYNCSAACLCSDFSDYLTAAP